MDVLIRGGRLIDPANGVDRVGTVLVRGGLIAAFDGDETAGVRVIEANGCIVSPGFVDLHAHLREPGFEHKGTIASETEAALRGGFTTVCAMPNTEPAPDSASVVESLLERIARDARVRVFAIGSVTRRREGKELSELGELAAAGVVAFSDDGSPVGDANLMRHALEYCAALGLPLSEHSDDPVLNGGGVMNEGRVSDRLGLKGQPATAEVVAVARNISIAELTGAHLHIAHVSTAQSVDLVAAAKARGVRVTCEVTPSHLFLTEDAVFGAGPGPAYDTNARINPPLRTEADRWALVQGLEAGVIDAIATDHAPHAQQDKLCEFDFAAPGISCFETALSSLMALMERGELRLETVIRALTIGPARSWGLDRRVPGLGSLTVGAPADIVVFDPVQRRTIDPARFASKGRNTPLAGIEMPGVVRAVVANGVLTPMEEAVHA